MDSKQFADEKSQHQLPLDQAVIDNRLSDDRCKEKTVDALLSEIEYARQSLTKIQEHIGRSFVAFYIPILLATGYALTSTHKIIFIGVPFLLFAYLGYISYLAFMQHGFAIYRCILEHALEKYLGPIPVTQYQREFVPSLYYDFAYWQGAPKLITRVFEIGTLVILSALVLIPSVFYGYDIIYNYSCALFYVWVVVLFGSAAIEGGAIYQILSSRPHIIWRGHYETSEKEKP